MDRVGRYLLCDEIASGGMASVHLGRLLGPVGFGRVVAMKRLHAHLRAEPEFVAMLLDEARIASRIYHPNVVQVLDVMTEGTPSLVLEYVHGESLSRLAKAQRAAGEPLDASVAVAILVDVLRGLHAAHETRAPDGTALGIVHRDVSPHNVLVDTQGTAKILDFGIAKARGRIQSTREGQLKGKLSYMSPEQLEKRPVDRRSDVYSASVVLWELLTGERLFTAESEGATVTSILRGDVSRPSTIAPDVPPALEAVVLRGLSANPDARFATAADMADALEHDCPVASPAHVAEWVKRRWPEASVRVERLAEIERARVNGTEGEETGSALTVARTETSSAPDRSRLRLVGFAAMVGIVVALGLWRPWHVASSRVATPVEEPAPPAPVASAVAAVVPVPAAVETAAAPAPKPVRKTTPAPSASATCDPPWTLDDEGNHVWKRACFR